jgi:hypothetical protein
MNGAYGDALAARRNRSNLALDLPLVFIASPMPAEPWMEERS